MPNQLEIGCSGVDIFIFPKSPAKGVCSPGGLLGARERWDRTPGGLKINNRSFSGNFKKAPIPPSPAPIAKGGEIPDESA